MIINLVKTNPFGLFFSAVQYEPVRGLREDTDGESGDEDRDRAADQADGSPVEQGTQRVHQSDPGGHEQAATGTEKSSEK